MNKSQLADIMLADQLRWQARIDAENAPLAESRAALEDWTCERPLLRGIGMVGTGGTNRRYPHTAPRTRTVGVAAPAPDVASVNRLAAGDVEPTVLCYNINDPSNVTVRTVSDIRANGKSAKNRAPVAATARTVEAAAAHVQPTLRHDYNN